MRRFAGTALAGAVLLLTPDARADPSAPPVIMPRPGGCTVVPAGGRPIHIANGASYVQTLPGGTRKVYVCRDGKLVQGL